MMGRAHMITGSSTWVTLSALAGPPHLVPLIVGGATAAAGALIPDLDHVGSTAARSLGGASRVVAHGVRWLSGGHRRGTHSLVAVALAANAFWLTLWRWPWWLPAALVVGVAVHIGGDMMTRTGCPLLWPARRRFWLLPALMRFTTGQIGELIAVVVWITASIPVYYWRWRS